MILVRFRIGIKRHFQQYFSNIVMSVLLVEETGSILGKSIDQPQVTDKMYHKKSGYEWESEWHL